MAKKKTETQENRPITVEDHRNLGKEHAKRSINAVNEALKFPTGDDF